MTYFLEKVQQYADDALLFRLFRDTALLHSPGVMRSLVTYFFF